MVGGELWRAIRWSVEVARGGEQPVWYYLNVAAWGDVPDSLQIASLLYKTGFPVADPGPYRELVIPLDEAAQD